MIVLRTKTYAALEEEQLTSKDLAIEQFRQQRQLMQTQRLKQKLQAQEARDRMKALEGMQKAEKEEQADQLKNQIQVKQQENTDGAKNVGLYKTRAKTTPPVGMPKH